MDLKTAMAAMAGDNVMSTDQVSGIKSNLAAGDASRLGKQPAPDLDRRPSGG